MNTINDLQEKRSRRGSSTVETIVCFVFIIAGLVFMAKYFQRAEQGNLFGATQSIGQQFDPRDLFSETQQVTAMSDTVKQQTLWSMFGADLRPVPEIGDFMWDFYRTYHPHVTAQNRKWILSSVPIGPVFREPAVQQSESNATWNVNRTATYNDAR